MRTSIHWQILALSFVAWTNAQITLPIIADPTFRLLSAESILRGQLGSWGIDIGPIDVNVDLGISVSPLKLPKLPTLGPRRPDLHHDTASEKRNHKNPGKRRLNLGLNLGADVNVGVRGGWGDAENVARGARGDTEEWFTYITVGTPPQSVPILPDTGSSDMFVFSTDCPSCYLNNHTAYDSTSSTTFAAVEGEFRLEYADGSSARGKIGTDLVTFGSSASVSASLTFGLATSSSGTNFRNSARSGVLGLGQDGMSSLPNGTTLFSALIHSGQLSDKLMGIRLEKGRQPRGVIKEEGTGTYVFGGMESSYIRGGRFGISWVDTTSSNYWGFPLDDISMGLVSTLVGDTQTPRRAIIDTGTSLIITSDEAADSIHRSISGSFLAKSGVWYIPCSSSWPRTQNLFFTIKGVRYGVPIEDLAWKASGVYPDLCISGVQGGMPYFTVLGDMFIKNHYVVLSYEDVTPRVGLGERMDLAVIL